MITRLEAHGYRCFPHLSVDVDRYQVLAGTNGAGKTTLLDLPVLLGDLQRQRRVGDAFLQRQESVAAPSTCSCSPSTGAGPSLGSRCRGPREGRAGCCSPRTGSW